MSRATAGWLDRPQLRPLRRLVFQVHLWLGLLLAVYIAVISVSGSAAVFRREFYRWFVPQSVASTQGVRLEGEELAAEIDRVYAAAGYRIVRFSEPERIERPVVVWMERGGIEHGRLFDPFARIDLGEIYPQPVVIMEWIVELHDDLLAGFAGRRVNGFIGGLVVLLVLTGAVVWWPGRRQWRRSLYVTPTMPRPLWHLHSAIGFWTFLLFLNWAVSGWYMGLPHTVEALNGWLDTNPNDAGRPLDDATYFLTTAHFGRFGGLGIRITWALLGLLPAVLVVTGAVVWWWRVVRPRIRAARRARFQSSSKSRPTITGPS